MRKYCVCFGRKLCVFRRITAGSRIKQWCCSKPLQLMKVVKVWCETLRQIVMSFTHKKRSKTKVKCGCNRMTSISDGPVTWKPAIVWNRIDNKIFIGIYGSRDIVLTTNWIVSRWRTVCSWYKSRFCPCSESFQQQSHNHRIGFHLMANIKIKRDCCSIKSLNEINISFSISFLFPLPF